MNSKKNFVWNSFIYSFKSILGILFPLITFPYVSNVLGPTNIGKVEYANSIVNYFFFLAALGIVTYAIREGAKVKNDFEALSKLSTELLIINGISSIVAYIGILIVCNIPVFSEYALLILINSFTILFTTLGMEWVYNVKEEFTYITIRYIISHILAIVFLFAFVKTAEDYYYYAIYIVISSCSSNIVNVFCLRKHINIFKRRKLDIKRHIKPVLVLFAINITATIYTNIDTTMLGIMKGDAEVGIYHAGLKIDKCLTSLLAALSLVAFSRSSDLLKDGDLSEGGNFKSMIKQFNGVLMLIAAPLTIGLVSVGFNITNVLFSSEYSRSGYVLMIISLNLILSAINRIYGHQILIGAKRDNQYLISTIMALLLDICLNYILIPYLGAIATSISTVIACLISTVYVMWCASKLTKIKEMLFVTLKYVFLSLPFLVVSFIVNRFEIAEIIKLIIIIIICVLYYIGALFIIKDPYIKEVIKLVKKDKNKKIS